MFASDRNSTSSSSEAKTPYTPLRDLPKTAGYKAGDVMVVFGELFARGYANGIVDEAARNGLKIIRSTVGRRDNGGPLRPLNEEELAAQQAPFINVPLEAGFDMEPAAEGDVSPCDQLKNVKMGDWETVQLDWAKVEASRKNGDARFRKNVAAYMEELKKHIPKGANVLFVHTMAGGVPRAKILMPSMNRVFKGTGDRHMPSEQFWNSDLGKLSAISFQEVTATTFDVMLELSAGIRDLVKEGGGNTHYVAYGYHGTEVLINGKYLWQSYAPYMQGWAKMKLEDVAKASWNNGVKATVFNCPEILTNSTTIFQGVEVPLYTLVGALRREGTSSPRTRAVLDRAQQLLKDEYTLDDILAVSNATLGSTEVQGRSSYEPWPMHNEKKQMETLIGGSEKIISMHKDEKALSTAVLSEEIFLACGFVMFHESWNPHGPVLWLGHEILAKALVADKTL